MAQIDVFFATNRNRLSDTNGVANFGDLAMPTVKGIAFGIATVDGVILEDPGAGKITKAQVISFGGIDQELASLILGEPERDIVVFVHGAANTFENALQRAAFNQNWLNNAPGRGVVIVVFSWPATSYRLWDLLQDLGDYRHDQTEARASDMHFVEFLQALYRFRGLMGRRRLTMLAHSMGNYMLGFGVERWFSAAHDVPKFFDDVILAAADEPSNTFGMPNGARLSDLWLLTNRITVYSSREDVLIFASHIVNGDWRLGHDGPPNRADKRFFPPEEYVFVDCTENEDYTVSLLQSPDRSHQYYRQSLTVRADVARVLKGLAPPEGARVYDQRGNFYTLPTIGTGV
jgi:esterase/lipase superfamily enzyme